MIGKNDARPFTVVQIDHVVLRVADIGRALAFYRDALGLPVERTVAELGLWQLRAGRSLIDLVAIDGTLGRQGGAAPGRDGRNVDHLCLRIAPFDRDRLAAHLAAHGIPAGDVARRYGADGFGPSLYVCDPDGNTVELKGPPEP
ncbi:MAG: VOC family protein [Alphaproteobacteria bacterium]